MSLKIQVAQKSVTLVIYIYILLAEVPGFSWGIPRTIKHKCAIIAHRERKAGEMPIITHHERKAGEMLISSVFMTKRCTIFTWINKIRNLADNSHPWSQTKNSL